jgi:hypothetical protein
MGGKVGRIVEMFEGLFDLLAEIGINRHGLIEETVGATMAQIWRAGRVDMPRITITDILPLGYPHKT